MVVLLRSGSRLVHYADEMLHRSDHAAHRRAVLKGAAAVPLVQAEPNQRRTLLFRPADRAADLLHGNRLRCFVGHDGNPWSDAADYSSAAAAVPRRAWSVEYLMPRCAATSFGCSWLFNASKVARTMLYGFDEPIDLATTSLMPSVSKTARIGPPAMMPVPGLAARKRTRPAPQRPSTS